MKAVNLLPSDLRSGPRRGRFASAPAVAAPGGAGPFLVLGALALCVLAMAAYVLAANTVTERRTELARVTAEHEAAARRAAALKPYGDFQEMALRRTQTVSSLAALRFDWEQALRDVSHALPGTVTLSSLDGSISTETGASSGQLRGQIPAPAITLKGCTRTQSAVATMMSRLRAVRGTTRVALSKSERVATTSGSDPNAAPCGGGTVPQFEVVMFFERSGAGAGALSAADEPLPGTGVTTTPAAGAASGAAATPGAGTPASPSPATMPAAVPGAKQPASSTPTPAGTPAP